MNVATLHFIKQRNQDASTAGSDRMTDRDSSSVDVDPIERKPQFFCDAESLDGEGFVEFVEVDLIERPGRASKNLLDSGNGSEHHPSGSNAAGSLCADRGKRRKVQFTRAISRHQNDGSGSIIHTGSVACGDGAIFFEGGLERGESFE